MRLLEAPFRGLDGLTYAGLCDERRCMSSSSSSPGETWRDFYDFIAEKVEELKENAASSLLELGANELVDALDELFFNDTGSHFTSTQRSAIKDQIKDIAMGVVTGSAGDKVDEGMNPSNPLWDTSVSLAPVDVEQDGPVSVEVEAGPIQWDIGGSPSVRWGEMINDLVAGDFQSLNPVNNLGASLTITGNDWSLSISGSVGNVISSGAGSSSLTWNVGFVFRALF